MSVIYIIKLYNKSNALPFFLPFSFPFSFPSSWFFDFFPPPRGEEFYTPLLIFSLHLTDNVLTKLRTFPWSTKFTNQNFREIGRGVPELWSDIQKHRLLLYMYRLYSNLDIRKKLNLLWIYDLLSPLVITLHQWKRKSKLQISSY